MPTPSESNTGQEDANGQKAEQAESNKNNNDSEQAKSNQQKNDSKQNEPASQPTLMMDDSVTITTESYDYKKLIQYICNGETLIILSQTKELIRMNSPDFVAVTGT